MNSLAIDVDNITVAYRSYEQHPATLKEVALNAILKRQLKYYNTFNALSEVSFKVNKGEVLGVIGSNGAGKSTLLKTLAGVLPPISGTITMEGEVDSLISLGAGFDPDLNAVENIYLNGSLHRKTRQEIAERVPHILEFAELENFAATPIRYYSSGMYARLGFSVIVDRQPEILLVDEILGVGDERFQQKCQKVFDDHLAANRTIVLVSHNIEFIRSISTNVALLSRGKLVHFGDADTAIEMYRDEHYRTALESE